MKKDPALPERVFPHGAWYRISVRMGGGQTWHRLSKIRDGLPALWRAWEAFTKSDDTGDKMPALIADWQTEVMRTHAPKTRVDEKRMSDIIAVDLADYHVAQVEPPDVVQFLKTWNDKPRMFNRYRSLVRELMRFAIEKGMRKAGTNPVDGIIRTKPERPRNRCPSTSELRRIKVGCLYQSNTRLDGKPIRTRSGLTMACLIELAYLTGQDVSVMIRLRDKRDPQQPDEPHVRDDGIFFRRDKTGSAVVIGWTPRLRAVVAALRKLKAERNLKKKARQRVETPLLFTKADGQPLTYEAVSNAWQRGLKRSGVAHCMFRDIRASAITAKEARDGMAAANAMGAHSTEAQTAGYVRRKGARKTDAAA